MWGLVSSVAVKAMTDSVLPRPMQCARMQPLPCRVHSSSVEG